MIGKGFQIFLAHIVCPASPLFTGHLESLTLSIIVMVDLVVLYRQYLIIGRPIINP